MGFRDVGSKVVFVGAEHPVTVEVGTQIGPPHCIGRLRHGGRWVCLVEMNDDVLKRLTSVCQKIFHDLNPDCV